jgi:hypothetical protein
VPFLLPLAMAAAAMVFDGVQARHRTLAPAFAIALTCVQFLAAPLVLHSWSADRETIASVWLTPHAPPFNPELPAELAKARQTVLAALAADAPFIGPNIILAAETGRSVPPDLRMGPFSFTVEIPPATAARLHLATHEELDRWFARPDVTLLGFFKRRELNYGWSMPTFGELEPEFHAQWFAPIRRDFVTAFDSGDDFVLMVRRPAR